jgi:hypothetical protein
VASESDRTARCHQHRSVRAGWRCGNCQKYLCSECVSGVLGHFLCCLCDKKAAQLTVARSERWFIDWVVEALVYPLYRGLKALLLLAVLLTGAQLALRALLDPKPPEPAAAAAAAKPQGAPADPADVTVEDTAVTVPGAPARPARPEAPLDPALSPMVFPPLRALLIFVYAVLIVVATARGGKSEPRAVGLTLKALVGTVIVWLPGAAYLVFVTHGFPARAVAPTLPLLWLFGALAAVYLPMALSAAASDAGLQVLVNPFRLFHWSVQAGRHYWYTVLAVALLGALAYVLASTGADLGQRITVPVLGTLLAQLVAILAFAAMARLIGRILWVRGDAFDWGAETDFHDPLLDQPARGARKRTQPAAGGDPASSGGETTGVRQKPEPMLAREVLEALAQRNPLRALKLYEARATWNEKLFTDRHLLDIGTAALNSAKLELAEKVLSRAAQSKLPIAGRAMLGLARTYEQAGRDPETIRALWQQIVQRFPGTDMAKTAANRLEAAAAAPPPGAGTP